MNELKNKILISTQPNDSFYELEKSLQNSGALLYHYTMIEIEEAPISIEQQNTLKNISKFDWLIFTSKNGVKYFLSKLQHINGNTIIPNSIKIAVIGNKTANELIKNGINPNYISKSNLSDTFAFELKENIIANNSNVLLMLGNLANSTIEDSLKKIATVNRINCYNTVATKNQYPELIKKVNDNKYDLIIFTSSSCFINFAQLIKKNQLSINNIKALSIGKATTKTMEEYGIKPLITAKQSNIEGIIIEITNFFK